MVPQDDDVAAQKLSQIFSPTMIDALLDDAQQSGTPLDGPEGLLNRMAKAVLERALTEEMTDHLGYESGDPDGAGTGNSRNGTGRKTVGTVHGPIELKVPRDRNGTFEPRIVPKHARRLGNVNDMILSLYSRGMTTRDIEAHLQEVYGLEASRQLISNVTDVILDEIKLWQARPLDEVYPIVYVDGIRLKIKDNGLVTTKTGYLVIGVDIEGRKHVLGCWIADSEGARFWQKIMTDLRNRGLRDILIACCDGLTGLPDAIRSAFPDTVVQTCVVHVIRNAMKFVSYQDRKKLATAMRAIYTAPTLEAAELAMASFEEKFGPKYPGAVAVWRNAWNDFIPFLDYPAELRLIVYTTNAIESINFQIRKITKNRGHFPDADAALKLIYLGLRNISSNRGGASGTGTYGWIKALNTLAEIFPGRLPM
jgi:putative transposase